MIGLKLIAWLLEHGLLILVGAGVWAWFAWLDARAKARKASPEEKIERMIEPRL